MASGNGDLKEHAEFNQQNIFLIKLLERSILHDFASILLRFFRIFTVFAPTMVILEVSGHSTMAYFDRMCPGYVPITINNIII